MRNVAVIIEHLESALDYLYKQEQLLKPFLDLLQQIINDKVKEQDLNLSDAFNMYIKIQEQYTNSIMLITKIKEILDFKD